MRKLNHNPTLRRSLSLWPHHTYPLPHGSRNLTKPISGKYIKIGAGACGAVFNYNPSPSCNSSKQIFAIKLAKAPNNTELCLWDDYVAHECIAEAFAELKFTELRVPECYFFIPKTDSNRFLSENPGLEEAVEEIVNLPTHALITERLPAVDAEARYALIKKYCAVEGMAAAMEDAANADCLVRVYLGSMKGEERRRFFSLRNFKLHLNQMMEIGLDVVEIGERMGKALAIVQ
jgi:hypothetical protein